MVEQVDSLPVAAADRGGYERDDSMGCVRKIMQPSARSLSTLPVQGRLHRRGDVWEAMWDGVDVAVRDSKGIRDLAVLLAYPRLPVPAVDLDGRVRSESITASALAASLTAEGTTLLQGDFWWHNLALPTDRVVLLDWGELTTTGPAALAVVQWLAHDADKLPWSHDRYLDEAVAAHARSGSRITAPSIDLAVLAVVAQMGWSRAGSFDFQWWMDRLEAALPTARSGDIL